MSTKGIAKDAAGTGMAHVRCQHGTCKVPAQ